MKIAILGDGGWGTTLAILLSDKGYKVNLWSAFSDYAKYLDENRENIKFLPGVRISREIFITSDTKKAMDGADVIVLAVPSQFLRSVIEKLAPSDFKDRLVISVIKGIEIQTLKRISEVIEEMLGDVNIAVLSGPSIALEVANGIPTTVVAASRPNTNFAKAAQELFTADRFRVYTSNDIIGVELGGALKNIIAIAAGINDGLGFGSNSKAALMVRGMVEITRLGAAMGANSQTFWGLSGMGDLITTCVSPYGRNRWFGEEVGAGKKPQDVLKETSMVVEGYATTKAAYELSKRYKTEMPITENMYGVLYQGKKPEEAVSGLMARQPKSEN